MILSVNPVERDVLNKKNFKRVNKAKEWAKIFHKDQKYGNRPYLYHLVKVDLVLVRFGFGGDVCLRQAAYLHDSVEDTGTSLEFITKLFGWDVAVLVWAVTDEYGKDRSERKIKTYPKIRSMDKAVILKLSDRIANIEECLKMKNSKLMSTYKKESRSFEFNLKFGREDLSDSEKNMWEYYQDIVNKVF